MNRDDWTRRPGRGWHDEPPGKQERDLRSHYIGGYGIDDYDQPVDPAELGGRQGRQSGADWLPEDEDEGRPYGRQPAADAAGPAWRQFTGYNERASRQRAAGGQRPRVVGPRGYQRPDERIREDICERLMRSGRLDVSEVEVTVEAGVVTLAGSVPDRQQKYRVEDIADDVYGVKDLLNRLRVPRTQEA
jgi:osmotically-inducible protein OsmY